MRRFLLVFVLLAVAGGAGCSKDNGPASGGKDAGGGNATGGASGSGGVGAGGSPNDAGATTGTGGAAGGRGGTGGGFTMVGVCAQRGMATANATMFDGYEERALIGEAGAGADVCAVRFDLKRVGDAPAGCTVCTWTHLLELSNPRVVTDTGGACANSELALDAAAIAAIAGTRVAIGFAKELGGAHGSARMKYFEATQTWDVFGNATWDESTNAFQYIYRNGICNY